MCARGVARAVCVVESVWVLLGSARSWCEISILLVILVSTWWVFVCCTGAFSWLVLEGRSTLCGCSGQVVWVVAAAGLASESIFDMHSRLLWYGSLEVCCFKHCSFLLLFILKISGNFFVQLSKMLALRRSCFRFSARRTASEFTNVASAPVSFALENLVNVSSVLSNVLLKQPLWPQGEQFSFYESSI